MHYEFVLDLRYIAAIRNDGDMKATRFENLVKITHFLTPVKFRGGFGQMSEERSATGDILL